MKRGVPVSGDNSDQTAKEFNVQIPDLEYWRANIPCQYACPVNTDARGYVRAIASKDFEKAYLIARGPNPLASICGRVCAAPCEIGCRRGKVDDPIAIRALKRFVTSSFGPESEPSEQMMEYLGRKLKKRQCEGAEELRNYLENEGLPARGEKSETVAIVGSGPAGLACAHDLALLGFKPVIYEMEPVPAGMLYVGVPEYRLPRALIMAEVDMIKSLGVEIKCNCEVGKDITLDELRSENVAVVLAVGAKKSRLLSIPGVEGPGVLPGVEFLRDVSLERPVEIGRKIVVIGGGSVSYDVARSAWRKSGGHALSDREPDGGSAVHLAYEDVTQVAARQGADVEVHLCCLESREQMLADPVDIQEGQEEGIVRHNSLGPQEVLRDGEGRVTGVRFAPVVSLFDESGKFSPTFDESRPEVIECDTVLISIGQICDVGFLTEKHGAELDGRGTPTHDEDSLMTTAAGVFVAGDLQTGPRLIIDAVASGKKAARGVYRHVTGKAISYSHMEHHFEIDDYSREKGYETIGRREIPSIPPEKRMSLSRTVEIGLDSESALREASRCYDCGVNTIFDGGKCILCGGCADVCPQLCLKLVSVDRLKKDDAFRRILGDRLGDKQGDASAIIKDETRCIRCGSCADRCPVHAVTMERFCFEQRMKMG